MKTPVSALAVALVAPALLAPAPARADLYRYREGDRTVVVSNLAEVPAEHRDGVISLASPRRSSPPVDDAPPSRSGTLGRANALAREAASIASGTTASCTRWERTARVASIKGDVAGRFEHHATSEDPQAGWARRHRQRWADRMETEHEEEKRSAQDRWTDLSIEVGSARDRLREIEDELDALAASAEGMTRARLEDLTARVDAHDREVVPPVPGPRGRRAARAPVTQNRIASSVHRKDSPPTVSPGQPIW